MTQSTTLTGRDWYEDVLNDEQRALYDMIDYSEFNKLDAEMCQEFMNELGDLGITTAEQFKDTLCYISDCLDPYADFVEYLVTDVEGKDLPPYLVIDWRASWDCSYRHDFSFIEFNGETYFFCNN